MAARLYYSNTIFSVSPPQDINPLILEIYRGKRILVLCCRDGQIIRLRKRESDCGAFLAYRGWWDAQKIGIVNSDGYIDREQLLSWDAVVILCRDRIQDLYLPLLQSVEAVFGRSLQIV